jgi:regulator of protease activity HflC (stomatin/prohibitin superfamily)
MSHDHPPSVGSGSDPYRGVVLVLLGAAALGMATALVGAAALRIGVLLGAAVALWMATGLLFGVARAQAARARPLDPGDPAPAPSGWTPERPLEGTTPTALTAWVRGSVDELRTIAAVVAAAGTGGVLVGVFTRAFSGPPPSAWAAAISAGLAFAAAGIAVTAARYFAVVEVERLPEGPGLSGAGRVLTWLLVLVGTAVGLLWAGYANAARALHVLVLGVEACICLELFTGGHPTGADVPRFPIELRVFSLLGSRANPLASLLDAAQRQLGIDLRSTWALTIVRRSVEPLVVALCALGWSSTALTVVGLEEQGLVERLGVPIAGPALGSGLHLHWPWPIDRVVRVPVRRVQSLMVGHEGEEESGPEDVLWARQHAASEYTLLLGDGRDLIAVDAAVQFRISDLRAWRYQCQNPADALRAIAYRAVMQSTVGRTLAQALSENVATLTAQMRAAVQADADALGLGVEVVGFTVGGMHPPVKVAADYQAVVSAELGRATAAIGAQAYRNESVPAAEAEVTARANTARAEGAEALARAAGEAWSFRALDSEFRAEPSEYRFRRRLETLERGLGGRHFTVLDARIQRDGGELWLMR